MQTAVFFIHAGMENTAVLCFLTNGVHDVGLAAAVGAHDGGDTPSELHDGLVGKGFKTLYFNGF